MITKAYPFYLQRPDNSSAHYGTPDFTIDNSWHNIDMSAVIPKGTQLVNFAVDINASAAAETFSLKAAGYLNDINASVARVLVAGIDNCYMPVLGCPDNRVFKYKASSAITNIELNVTSVFCDGHFHYADAGDRGSWDFAAGNFTADENWHELDLSGIVPAGVRAVLLRCLIYHPWYNYYVRFADEDENDTSWLRTTFGGLYKEGDFLIRIKNPSAPKIKYWMRSSGYWTINAAMKGWWF